jgi:signal transduction histidine kinase/CHASE3 domain sensor protein
MIVASGLLAVIVGGAFAAVLLTITDLRGTTELRRQTREELIAADTLEKYIIDLETGQRGFVITRDESFLEPARVARAALPGSARALERLAADDPVQRARVRRIVEAVNAYIRDYALPLVEAVRRNDPSVRSVARTLTAKQRVDALRQGLNSFREAERARLAVRDADVDTASRRATAAAAVGIAGSILLILLFAGYLTRVIVRPLRRAAGMADRLAGGDLSTRMRETDVAEIGTLERSFNVMAGSLEASRDELASLLAEQSALRRVATLVAKESSPEEVFARVAEEVASVHGDVECALVRDEGDGTGSAVAIWGGDASAVFPVGARLPLDGDSVVASVLRDGRPRRIDDYSAATGTIAERTRAIGIRSAVGCPIVVGGRTWGAIAVASHADEPFPPDAEIRISRFSELVATSIGNADARAEVERLAEEQAALRRVATLVADGASPTAVFDAVAAEMEKILDADRVVLNRYESDVEVTVLAHRGSEASQLPPGSRVSHEIVVDGRHWGTVVANWNGERSPPPDTEARMAKFARLLDTAIANADGRDQLSASRTRLLTAETEARRRVVRDLHDGAQQRLVHTILTLKLAQRVFGENDAKAESLIGEALDGAERANAELRELARGILPAVLTHGGLNGGVRAMVARLDLPVHVDVPAQRFPAETEASAYFILAEALTNVVKHARARHARVRAYAEDGMLHLAVRDDGIGGADPRGHGLVGMGDRAAALGGRIEIDSPVGGGTLLAATLPLPHSTG